MSVTNRSKQYTKNYEFTVDTLIKTIKLKIWDTPGTEHFQATQAFDYNHADVILLVYSIDKDSTFEALEDFMEDAKKFNTKTPKFFLIGNKSDLDAQGFRQVQRADAKSWGIENKVDQFHETCAKDSKNIDDLF